MWVREVEKGEPGSPRPWQAKVLIVVGLVDLNKCKKCNRNTTIILSLLAPQLGKHFSSTTKWQLRSLVIFFLFVGNKESQGYFIQKMKSWLQKENFGSNVFRSPVFIQEQVFPNTLFLSRSWLLVDRLTFWKMCGWPPLHHTHPFAQHHDWSL